LHCLANLPVLAAAHRQLDQTKTQLIESCQGLGLGVINTHANFLLLEDSSERRLAKALFKARIRFSDCSVYPHSGELLANLLRVAIPGPGDVKTFTQALHSAASPMP
jgi:histidinol-phosphate aminotransferase